MAAEDDFYLNLLKMIAANSHFQTVLLASREMFGRSYFSLGPAEKAAVDQAVIGHVGSNYGAITPEFLAGPGMSQPVGFGIPRDQTPSGNPFERK